MGVGGLATSAPFTVSEPGPSAGVCGADSSVEDCEPLAVSGGAIDDVLLPLLLLELDVLRLLLSLPDVDFCPSLPLPSPPSQRLLPPQRSSPPRLPWPPL